MVSVPLGLILVSVDDPSADRDGADTAVPCDKRLDFDTCETRSPSGVPKCEWAENLTLVIADPCQSKALGPTCIKAELEGGVCSSRWLVHSDVTPVIWRV